MIDSQPRVWEVQKNSVSLVAQFVTKSICTDVSVSDCNIVTDAVGFELVPGNLGTLLVKIKGVEMTSWTNRLYERMRK